MQGYIELREYKNDSTVQMYVSFEIATHFPSPHAVKSAAISKQTHIWTPSSRSYIVLALVNDYNL